jgi:iron-sulfur cluster assembly protein
MKYRDKKTKGIRFGVRTTGCSGMAYVLDFTDSINKLDCIFETEGVKIIVDSKSIAYLQGTELDYVKEGLNEGFQFNNPNVQTQCGCGESFGV